MKVLASSCLLGERCRWHGKKTPVSAYVKRFVENNPEAEIVPVCPEMLGGLPCPRPPVKRRGGRVWETCEDKTMRSYVTGKEVTTAYIQGAEETLKICKDNNCKVAIMCKHSPSCDISGIAGAMLVSAGVEVINTF